MTAETLLIFFISYILLHIKPGPGQAFRISCALDKGLPCAMSVSVGVATICTVYFLVVALSYGNLIQHFESFAPLFKALGGLYLIYLGTHGFIKYKSNIPKKDTPNSGSLFKFFLIGAVLSLSNPMDIVYFISVLPNLIQVGELTNSGIMLGASIVFFTGIIIDILILTLVIQAKHTFINNQLAHHVSIGANLSFILIGAFFVFSALFMDDYTLNLL